MSTDQSTELGPTQVGRAADDPAIAGIAQTVIAKSFDNPGLDTTAAFERRTRENLREYGLTRDFAEEVFVTSLANAARRAREYTQSLNLGEG